MAKSLAASVALVAMSLGAFACTPLRALEDVSERGRNTSVSGEIRSVDTRSGRLTLRDHSGRNRQILFDRATSVVYRQRRYPVSALERGDQVDVRVTYDRGGRALADRIVVRDGVRDRGRATARIERVDGTVASVDSRRGAFTLATGRNRSIRVHLPADASRSERVRFGRLRRGERLRADVRAVGRAQYELVRFR